MAQAQTRIEKLRNLNILDTDVEAEFESITEIATYICNTPISLVTLIEDERMWFKSARGMGDVKEVPTKDSFCKHVIASESGEMVINDLREDERFAENVFVCNAPNAQFYAGVSIETSDGHRLGTVCVIDTKPRKLTKKQKKCIRLLADYTVKLIELRNSNTELEDKKNTLMNINHDLEQYAYAIAHDIKAPLRIMNSFSKILLKQAYPKLSDEEKEFFQYIINSTKELSDYTQNLLKFSQKTQLDVSSCSDVNISSILSSLELLLNKDKEVTFFYDNNLPVIFTSEIGLRQIFQNLISNAIRYRDPEAPTSYIGIECSINKKEYVFKIIDNGIGMSEQQQETIFHLFTRDKMNKESTGIGLNIVKRLIEKMDGTLSIKSALGKGTTITFSVRKILK